MASSASQEELNAIRGADEVFGGPALGVEGAGAGVDLDVARIEADAEDDDAEHSIAPYADGDSPLPGEKPWRACKSFIEQREIGRAHV